MSNGHGIDTFDQTSQHAEYPVETTPLLARKSQRSTAFLSRFWRSIDGEASTSFSSVVDTPSGVPREEPAPSSSVSRNRGKGKSDPTSAIQLVLINNGSVARDHLASERTFLAYTRTSLAISSVGVALIQFLRLGDTAKGFGYSLGAAAICTGILVQVIGTVRYFAIQHALPNGFFPAARAGIVAISFLIGVLITSTFGILMVERLRHR